MALGNNQQNEIPILLRDEPYDVVKLVEAANYYIAKGEGRLIDDSKNCKHSQRVAWLCRIIYESKSNDPLRGAAWGAYSIPYKTMPSKDWPLLPLVKAGNSYFVMGVPANYIGAIPESVQDYISYCKGSGTFRKNALPVPSSEDAERDLTELLRSRMWKAMKWSDLGGGNGYVLQEFYTIDGLKKQIPRNK
jgi:hypothetical protein